jgi:hypothetical protein
MKRRFRTPSTAHDDGRVHHYRGEIAITLLVLFSRLNKATGRKIAGATSALDADAGSEAESLAEEIDENKVKNLNPDGSFQ